MAKAPQHRRIVGDNIRQARKHAGLTQEQLAEKSDLHPVYVGCLERGEENVSLDSLERIARALKVPVRSFFDGV